jgi:hypothetical protein
MKLTQVPISNTLFNQHPDTNTLTNSPGTLISHLLPNAIVLASIIFFFLILFGGFGLIVGAGKQSDPKQVAKAKDALTWGVIGFLIVISSYFILQILSELVGFDLLNPLIP